MKLPITTFPLGLAVMAAFFAAPARAQVIFTITATANSNVGGYLSGQPYTFIFTTPSSYPTPPSTNNFGAATNNWTEDFVSDQQLWTSIGGTGLQGSLVRPTSNSFDPYSYIIANSPNILGLVAGNDSSYGIGLNSLGGSANNINEVYIQISSGGPAFGFSSAFVNPVAYFDGAVAPGYLGTYSSISGSVQLFNLSDLQIAAFTVTSLTISAVPEPSTFGALVGLTALGFAAYRRRQRQAG